MLKEDNSLTGTGSILNITHIEWNCAKLFGRKGIFFHLFNNKTVANTLVGKQPHFSKKENTPKIILVINICVE